MPETPAALRPTPVVTAFLRRQGLVLLVRRSAGVDVPLEEMAGSELGYPQRPGILLRNTYFDIAPARLIRAWFTERGGNDQWGPSPM